MRRKTKRYAPWVLLVCIAMIIGYFALWTDREVTVYSDKFRILDYRLSYGTTHTIYCGNQTVGSMRAMLRDRLRLKFIRLSPAAVMVMEGPKSRAFLLRYTGDFPSEELKGLRAVLTNDKDISKELVGINMPFQADQTFVGWYILPVLPTSEDSFRIDLRLKSADDPIASWRAGKLYKHNRGIDSDQQKDTLFFGRLPRALSDRR